MITLITGSLGTGKTALAIKLLTESEFYPNSVFVYGVRDWKGAGTYFPLKGQERAAENQKLLEETGRVSHACYLVDEAKKVWPTRVAGRDEPPFINTHLAESRSVSQDWILTAQAPGQIDVALRRLVGRHIHLEKTPLGIRYSEAGKCRDDLKFEAAESRKFTFPVESLKLYSSDEGVTTQQKKTLKIPSKLVWLLAVVVAMLGIVVWSWSNSSLLAGVSESVQEQNAAVEKTGGGLFGPKFGNSEILPVQNAPHVFYYKPRDPDYPEIARAPRYPVSCVSMGSRCLCYDQAAQRLDVGPERCQQIVDGSNELATLYPRPEVPTYRTGAPTQDDKATAPAGRWSRPSQPVDSSMPSSPPPDELPP